MVSYTESREASSENRCSVCLKRKPVSDTISRAGK